MPAARSALPFPPAGSWSEAIRGSALRIAYVASLLQWLPRPLNEEQLRELPHLRVGVDVRIGGDHGVDHRDDAHRARGRDRPYQLPSSGREAEALEAYGQRAVGHDKRVGGFPAQDEIIFHEFGKLDGSPAAQGIDLP